MSALTDLRDKLVNVLVNIVDAGYPGDPAGTPANAAYFNANVHNYLKILGVLSLPENTHFVSPTFAGIGSPYFIDIPTAYAAISGSSSSNKYLIDLGANKSSYPEALTIDGNQWVMVKGVKYASVISGSVAISNGTTIFKGVTFQDDIVVSGGLAVFEDCHQTTGTFTISGGIAVVSNCESWGFVNAINAGNTLFLEGIKNIQKGTGGDANNSITLAASVTTGDYVFHDLTLVGVLNNASSVTPEESNIVPNGTERPTY